MSTEVIANLWTFVKNGFAYEVGVRLYMVPGNDDEKFAILNALAPFDFHFAQRFPIPSNFKVVIVDAGRSKEFSGLLQPIPDEYLDCFRDVWDPLKQSIPEHKIGTSAAVSTRAPLQTSNLLSINTYIEVDANGSQVAQIPNPQFSGQQPKLLLNRWAFADAGLSHVFSVAGRAYMAVGNDTQLAHIFSTLASDDYLLSRRIPISSSTATVKTSDVLSQQSLFDDVLRDIQQSIPLGRLDWITEKTTKFSFQPAEAKLKTSVVMENQEGKVSVADAAPTRAETGANSSRVLSPSSAAPAPTSVNKTRMADEWYYSVGGEKIGPLSSADLRQLATSGRLQSDHHVWKEGLVEWVKARNIKGLFQTDSTSLAASRPPQLPINIADSSSLVESRKQQPCPFCGEQILVIAKKCRFCGEWIDKDKRLERFAVPIKVVPVWNIPFFVVLTLHIYWVFWLYRIFKELHAREFTLIKPGTAVGRLFIPIYGFYWLFVVFAELKRAIERAYGEHHQLVPPTGWVWVMPVVWLPGSFLTAFTGGAGIPFTMIGASLTLCFVQSWMNHLAAIEAANRPTKPMGVA